jgi:hypothetical protein
MAHRVAPEVRADIDGIWYRIVNDSGNLVASDRIVDAITERPHRRPVRPIFV